MKAPQGLKRREFLLGKDHECADYDPNSLKAWAQNTMNPKYMRLLLREAEPILRPNSLRGRFTAREAHAISETLLMEGFYEIADLTGSALQPIRDRITEQLGSPQAFELTMAVESIANTDGKAVSASSADLFETHGHTFSTDFVTESVMAHLLGDEDFHNDATCNALCLDIRGDHLEDDILYANNRIKGLASYGYNSRVVKPTLNMALQGAISRMSLSEGFIRPSTTRTTAIGPKGSPILVMTSSPTIPIALWEEADLEGDPTGIGLPNELVINHCLFKQLIAREDLN